MEEPREKLGTEARRQAAVVELTAGVLAGVEAAALMQRAVAVAADALGAAYCAVWELTPERETLVRRASVGWPEDAGAGTTLLVAPESAPGASVLGALPVVVTDWPSETRFQQAPVLRERGVISSLAVVIPGREVPFGSLEVDYAASRRFGEEEILFLQAVAQVLALAVERRRAAEAAEQAVAEERQRLARELHDSVTQALYSITLHAEGTRLLLTAGEVGMAGEALRGLQDTAQEALDEMRLLIFELRPPILAQVGLAAALQARLSAVEGRANLRTTLYAEEVGALPAAIEQALYRIAQEALNNVLKYARAQEILVHLGRGPSGVVLEITDDGVGFDPVAAQASGGLGLRGIAERVAQLAGTFALRSEPGGGTQLTVEVPL